MAAAPAPLPPGDPPAPGPRSLAELEPADKARLDDAFAKLYRAHLRDVYSYAYYRVGNHHDAEDLTEQTFLQAYRHFERAQRESNGRPLRPWLIRIAHNLADRKSTRLNSSHANISYAVFCLKKK